MVSKISTGVILLSGIGEIVTPERRTPRKSNIKLPSILSPRKYSIPNQDSKRIIAQQDPNLPPNLTKRPTVHKLFIADTKISNTTENEHNDSTDTSRTDNEYYMDKMNIQR